VTKYDRSPDKAASVTREVCRNLKQALSAEGIQDFLIVSRSDSTCGALPNRDGCHCLELGPIDAHFLVPAFLKDGSPDSLHYLIIDGVTPVHETEFARDSVFGYSHSYLPDYVEQKTQGRIRAQTVERFY